MSVKMEIQESEPQWHMNLRARTPLGGPLRKRFQKKTHFQHSTFDKLTYYSETLFGDDVPEKISSNYINKGFIVFSLFLKIAHRDTKSGKVLINDF